MGIGIKQRATPKASDRTAVVTARSKNWPWCPAESGLIDDWTDKIFRNDWLSGGKTYIFLTNRTQHCALYIVRSKNWCGRAAKQRAAPKASASTAPCSVRSRERVIYKTKSNSKAFRLDVPPIWKKKKRFPSAWSCILYSNAGPTLCRFDFVNFIRDDDTCHRHFYLEYGNRWRYDDQNNPSDHDPVNASKG